MAVRAEMRAARAMAAPAGGANPARPGRARRPPARMDAGATRVGGRRGAVHRAHGGAGGFSYDATPGAGGAATSNFTLDDTLNTTKSINFVGTSTATGGEGGGARGGANAAAGGAGGAATATLNLTGARTVNAFAT